MPQQEQAVGHTDGGTVTASVGPGPDPRPLTREPLCLDLLNTRWHDRHGRHDLLTDLAGLALWLAGSHAAPAFHDGELRADRPTLDVARQARAALAGVVGGRPDATGLAAFNRILAPGRIRRTLTPDGPAEYVEVDEPQHRLGWLAGTDYLRLLTEDPDRIRPCATLGCGLYFYDASRNGTRRWCTRTGCGNRARVARHYAARASRAAP
ncbi:CGNR zinc finger domain-containing protein [Streptomyces sp. NPDC007346]|uniref:CGNR zinc finger domain-containing protein n=1 Tax=Streptomyces sp. NPDC007346 TaxID=3154682 RepID=UPI0034547BD1